MHRIQTENKIDRLLVEPIRTQDLVQSDFYEIKQWAFDLTEQDGRSEGYNDCFCLVFVNTGNFTVDLATQH